MNSSGPQRRKNSHCETIFLTAQRTDKRNHTTFAAVSQRFCFQWATCSVPLHLCKRWPWRISGFILGSEETTEAGSWPQPHPAAHAWSLATQCRTSPRQIADWIGFSSDRSLLSKWRHNAIYRHWAENKIHYPSFITAPWDDRSLISSCCLSASIRWPFLRGCLRRAATPLRVRPMALKHLKNTASSAADGSP